MRLLVSSLIFAVSMPLASAQSRALAAPTLEEEQAAANDEPSAREAPERLSDEQADTEEQEPREQIRDATDPIELPNTDYFFLGVFYRHMFIPGFIQEIFLDGGGVDGSNPATGLELNWRRNNFNVIGSFWWANAQGQGFARGNGANVTETEFIQANMGAIYLSAAFVWSFPIVDWFAIDLGIDVGFGFVYGNVTRTEAFRTGSTAPFQPCAGPGDPRDTNGYCETAPLAAPPCYANDGGHYGCVEPNWFTRGGDVPFIIPWITLPRVALRFKPIHQMQIRVEGGYNLYGFFMGSSLSYGF